ncbi:hypothetical protein [Aliiroseovarius subalbicans]|uniref:hypothetical protein n=1 Tax=Aliiroseovarius subalbicans TaxID=2925840 RepID=UPI001F568B00|nr:hypothetical protein [Aliiroseovarius subalbicans]MCI2400448.1 hypothetical protein [Aliiroseovarius subalbicans]
MANEWIIDVLTDLKAFAERNGLEATVDVLDDARLVALAELASSAGGKAETTRAHESDTRDHPGLIAGRNHA